MTNELENADMRDGLRDAIAKVYAQARLAGACGLFTGGEETIGEMAELLLSPQGIEFCTGTGCPSLGTFRLFRPYLEEGCGVYIDAGCVNLRNPGRTVLVGKTTANVTCDVLMRNEITVLRGAKASVLAFNWAVVAVHRDAESECITSACGNAVIL